MKSFKSMFIAEEASSNNNPFGLFSFFFGSSSATSGSSKAKDAKDEARKNMIKDKIEKKKKLKEKKDEIKAELIKAKSNFRRNQYNARMQQKLDALQRRLDKVTKLKDMYDPEGKGAILYGPEGLNAFDKMLNNVKNGLPEDAVSDAEYIQAKITDCTMVEDENGEIRDATRDEMQAKLAKVVENDPKVKAVLKKHGCLNDDGTIKQLDEDDYETLMNEFAGQVVDEQAAQNDVDEAEAKLQEIESKQKTIAQIEEKKKKLDEYQTAVDTYEAIDISNADSSVTGEFMKYDEEGNEVPKSWDEVKANLEELGVDKDMYEAAVAAAENPDSGQTIADFLNSADQIEKRKDNLKSKKEEAKNNVKSKASDADIEITESSFEPAEEGRDSKLTKAAKDKESAINAEITQVLDGADDLEALKKQLEESKTLNEKKRDNGRTRIEEAEAAREDRKQRFKDSKEIARKYETDSNENVKKLRKEIEESNVNGGEIVKDGKVGVMVDGKFMERPKPGEDTDAYKEACKLSVLSQMDKDSEPIEVVEPVLNDEGEITNEKEYKEYLQKVRQQEADEATRNDVLNDIKSATALKEGAEPTEYQKKLMKHAAEVLLSVDPSELTDDQKTMLEKICKANPDVIKNLGISKDDLKSLQEAATSAGIKATKATDFSKTEVQNELKEALKALNDGSPTDKQNRLVHEFLTKHGVEDLSDFNSLPDDVKKALEGAGITENNIKEFEDKFKDNGEDFDDDAEDDDGNDDTEGDVTKEPTDPRKVWKRKHHKITKEPLDTFVNKKGSTISKDEFQKKMKNYQIRLAKWKKNQATQTSSLSISAYLKSKLLLS